MSKIITDKSEMREVMADLMKEYKEQQRRGIRADPDEVSEIVKNGDMFKAAHLISAAYLITSIANSLVDDIVDIFDKYGFMVRGIKHQFKSYESAFDKWEKLVSGMVDTKGRKLWMANDFEKLEGLIREYIDIDNNVSIGYETENCMCVTPCPFIEGILINSQKCTECIYYDGIDENKENCIRCLYVQTRIDNAKNQDNETDK